MTTTTITYSLSYTSPTGARLGTYLPARDYAAVDTAKADQEWGTHAADYRAAHPDAIDVAVCRSEPWEKMSSEEHMAQIDRVNEEQALPFERMQIWDR